jgi:hypothetical protein
LQLETFFIHKRSCYFVKAQDKQKPYYQGARDGNIKTYGEIQGSIKIGAFSNFTLYFYPLFFTHPGFLTAP